MVQVELLLVPDCPNTGAARAVITQAMALAGVTAEVTERVGEFPSPTIAVAGRDVMTGQPVAAGAGSCRLGLPTARAVAAALSSWREGVAALGGDAYPPQLSVGVTSQRLATVSPAARLIHRAILTGFSTTGSAPSTAQLAAQAAGPTQALLAELHDHDVIRLDVAGEIRAAYPFSATPTIHRVQIERGPEVYAMCAVDALGMAAMLGRTVEITSEDPVTGTGVVVTVTPDGDTTWQPQTTVVMVGHRDIHPAPESREQACCDTGPAADRCCGVMNFFETEYTASTWLDRRADVDAVVLNQAQAWRLGVDIFGRLFEVA